ncbi:MAG: type II secretion system protein [Thermoguttaceae bacterium]
MNRRGMTLIELIVAATILGTLLVVCLQLLTATAAMRRSLDQRQLATIELGNVLERLATRRWTELTPAAATAERVSESVAERLPKAELKVVLTELTEPAPGDRAAHSQPAPQSARSQPAPLPAKRITASIRWQDSAGVYLPPVTVTTWRYWKDGK